MLRLAPLAFVLAATAAPPFDVRSAKQTGLVHVLNNSATPEKHLIETMTGGIAALDYDGDGNIDLFTVNGGRQPSLEKQGPEWWNRLYRGRGDGRFEDVTQRAGLSGKGYAMGAAAGDYDNDGRPDIFVACVRGNQLFRNRGDGTFEEVTARSGIAQPVPVWSVAGGWFDFNADGHLDLFVVNYVRWDPATEPFCGDQVSRRYRAYCHPKEYQPQPNQLFRNNGDGTFTDVSAGSGVSGHAGKGMGVAFADYDADGRIDVFVTNDATPNFLFHNEGGGRFREVAAEAGIALNDDGRATSSMGADFRDVDNDGRPDLFITALANETFPFYRNLGKGVFADRTYPARIGAATLPLSGWGAGIYDFDNDGRKDLFAATGDVQDNTELYSSRASRQRCILLLATPNGQFTSRPVTEAALHRGAAFADFDNDGRVDVAVTRLNETPLVLMNRMDEGRHWLGFRLKGTRSNRAGAGALIHIKAEGGPDQWNAASTSVGYSSASAPVVHFGLGTASRVTEAEIRWPSGTVQKVPVPGVDRYLEVEEP